MAFPSAGNTALEAVAVSRSFEGVRALEDVTMAAQQGSVHALIGENGAGKSTLIKILSGVLAPDSGSLRVAGEAVPMGDPLAMRARGVRTVFQELTLLPWMTVAENLLFGVEPRGRLRLIRRRELADRASEVLDRFGVRDIDPRSTVAQLSVARQQVLEIVTALLKTPEILLLDEPTSALSGGDVEWLFGLVRALQEKGGCVIFTSHRWQEITELATMVTIVRNGKSVQTAPSFSQAEAVRLMTGRTIGTIFPARSAPPPRTAARALTVEGLTGHGVAGVSFDVREGEILGIGGLAGQGQRELLLMLFGALRARTGEIRAGGERLRLRSPRDAIRKGIVLVPEDRKREGLFLPMTVRDNLTVTVLHRIATGGIVRSSRERSAAAQIVDQLQIATHRPAHQRAQTLSGGNQQKILIGRWLLSKAKVMLLFDLTRGVDVGTKHDMYDLIMRQAGAGTALIVYTTETEELAHLCHRVLVMREGRLVAELANDRIEAQQIVDASLHAGTEQAVSS